MVAEELTAEEYEQVFNWLLDRQEGAPWDLKLTEGYHVRRDSLVETYRNNPIFQDLRDPDRLSGKCRGCGYRAICGGSRSRAFAHYGDYLASDPARAYEPTIRGGSQVE